jgi:putative two-component system response regulator
MKILIMDDEADIRAELIECLKDEGFDCLSASNGEEGLSLIRQDTDIAVVLADLHMPGRSGLDVIAMIKAETDPEREIEFVIATGHGGSAEAIEALKLGVMDFIVKPVTIDYVIHVVRRAEELVLLKRARRHYEAGLKADVEAKTAEIKKLYRNLESAYAEALDCLAVAAEYKDPETGNHIHRIGVYAEFVAQKLGWSAARQEMMLLAAPLHDAGKIGTPETVLLKPGKLTAEEVVVMKQHAVIGARILSNAKHPVMRCAATIAGGHHERWDGGGYPRGLKGTQIPIEARITSLVDVYDALRSERPYKPAFDHDKTCSIIIEGDGRTEPGHFDPEILAIFREHSDEFAAIFERLSD